MPKKKVSTKRPARKAAAGKRAWKPKGMPTSELTPEEISKLDKKLYTPPTKIKGSDLHI